MIILSFLTDPPAPRNKRLISKCMTSSDTSHHPSIYTYMHTYISYYTYIYNPHSTLYIYMGSSSRRRNTYSYYSTKRTMSQFLVLVAVVLAADAAMASASRLQYGYYSQTCPQAEKIVRDVIGRNRMREPRSAASVMRLQFHDCFVNGCDASLLLDDTPNMLGEKLALSNINSLRSYQVIDETKEELELACPGVVSCADILIMAARDAVELSGGPRWEVKLGRLDSLTTSQEDSNRIMPSPRANATFLIDLFKSFNLSITDLVALSGSHSIGQARCFSIVFRLYNQSGTGRPDPNLNPTYREKLDHLCPLSGDGNVTGDLDATPRVFDNQYFKDLVNLRGFLNSDQTLFSGNARTRELVRRFSRDQQAFFSAFVEGMVKLGDLQSGQPGEVRKNCRVVNKPVESGSYQVGF